MSTQYWCSAPLAHYLCQILCDWMCPTFSGEGISIVSQLHDPTDTTALSPEKRCLNVSATFFSSLNNVFLWTFIYLQGDNFWTMNFRGTCGISAAVSELNHKTGLDVQVIIKHPYAYLGWSELITVLANFMLSSTYFMLSNAFFMLSKSANTSIPWVINKLVKLFHWKHFAFMI